MNTSVFKILVVDDSEWKRAQIRSLMSVASGQSLIVIEAKNSDEALSHLRRDAEVNVIILDYLLTNSELNGLELGRYLQKHYCHSQIKIFFYTDHFNAGNIVEVEKICDGIIPCYKTPEEILELINKSSLQALRNDYSDEELELLGFLSEGASNEEIALHFFIDQKIEKYFNKNKEHIEKKHDDENSSSIKNILYYYYQYGLEIKPFKKMIKKHTRSHSSSGPLEENEKAEAFRKAIRCLPALNGNYSIIQSEIPETWEMENEEPKNWEGLIKRLDIWIETFLVKNPDNEENKTINALIENFYDESLKDKCTSQNMISAIQDASGFANKVRESGYLNKREIKHLYQEINAWIDDQIYEHILHIAFRRQLIRRFYEHNKKESYVVDFMCSSSDDTNKSKKSDIEKFLDKVKNRKLLPDESQDLVEHEKSEKHKEPENHRELKKNLEKWIEDNLRSIKEEYKEYKNKELSDASPNDTLNKQEQKKHLHNEMELLNKEIEEINPLLRNVTRKCSNLGKKLNEAGLIPTTNRNHLVCYAAKYFFWKSNIYHLSLFLESLKTKFDDNNQISVDDIGEFSNNKIETAFVKTIIGIFNYYIFQELINSLKVKISLVPKIADSESISLEIRFTGQELGQHSIYFFPNKKLLHAEMKAVNGDFNFESDNNSHIFKLSAPLPTVKL
ncbi:DNA-binding NarL/FixJ family response regulator [Nitrosomonas ureae]|uniref:response regulator n=1 Tax=Nitrosomonas ureae TaxID=44577 RepID=UPI000D767374|nr:response regulator [Nitrosomonas ureae]PXX09477.1 DNA-binding NarL/FixJ family response regulator [Nitrosomonas ureae]